MKLTIELVPSTAWGNNLRQCLPTSDWDRLRKAQYAKANYVCEVCGGKGPSYPVECHEIWKYDDQKHIQTLVGLVALCSECHSVKHFGRSISVGKGGQAKSHMARVNGISRPEVERVIQQALVKWKDRSRYQWTLDLSWLATQGVTQISCSAQLP